MQHRSKGQNKNSQDWFEQEFELNKLTHFGKKKTFGG